MKLAGYVARMVDINKTSGINFFL